MQRLRDFPGFNFWRQILGSFLSRLLIKISMGPSHHMCTEWNDDIPKWCGVIASSNTQFLTFPGAEKRLNWENTEFLHFQNVGLGLPFHVYSLIYFNAASGAVAERVKLGSYMIFAIINTSLKNKIKNIEAQIGKILKTPSLTMYSLCLLRTI